MKLPALIIVSLIATNASVADETPQDKAETERKEWLREKQKEALAARREQQQEEAESAAATEQPSSRKRCKPFTRHCREALQERRHARDRATSDRSPR